MVAPGYARGTNTPKRGAVAPIGRHRSSSCLAPSGLVLLLMVLPSCGPTTGTYRGQTDLGSNPSASNIASAVPSRVANATAGQNAAASTPGGRDAGPARSGSSPSVTIEDLPNRLATRPAAGAPGVAAAPAVTTRPATWPSTQPSRADVAAAPLQPEHPDPDIGVLISRPPAAWVEQPAHMVDGHPERTWVSPSGSITVGIVRASLPFFAPVPLIVGGYVDRVREIEGTARLERKTDQGAGETRFQIAAAKLHHDVRLIVSHGKAYFAYLRYPADTLPPADELATATAAVESVHLPTPGR